MTVAAEAATPVERLTVAEHFMVAEYVPARPPDRRAKSWSPIRTA
jgi:hypothetical protein